MFDQLNSVNRVNASQFDGTADGIPEHVTALLADSENERDNALTESWKACFIKKAASKTARLLCVAAEK